MAVSRSLQREPKWNWGALPGLLACVVPLVLHFTGVAFK